MIRGARSLFQGAFAGGSAPLVLGNSFGRPRNHDNGHNRRPFSLTRQGLSVNADNGGTMLRSKRGHAVATLRRLVTRLQSSSSASAISESSSSSIESFSNGNGSNGSSTPGTSASAGMLAKGLGMPPKAPIDAATTAAEAEATAKREASLRHQAIAQMRAYLWPKGDLRTKTLLLTSLALLIAGKVVNAQVCDLALMAATFRMIK